MYLISRNTSILNIPISKESIDENNKNLQFRSPLGELVTKQIIVNDNQKNGIFSGSKSLLLPEDFEIYLFVSGLSKPRFMDFLDSGEIVVTDQKAGKVLLINDPNNDNFYDQIIEIDSGLRNPHGIDFFEGDLFVAEEHQVVKYTNLNSGGKFENKSIVISNLPSGGGHVTRTVLIGPDRKIYLSIGSSCNVCEESDNRRATIMKFDLDGSNGQIYAEGLRNTVGIIFNENSAGDLQLWGVDMGRDLIGDDIPPEEVNIIESAQHYGWPYCYGNKITNPEYTDRANFCLNETKSPKYQMQAHSAPLGLTSVPEKVNLPIELDNNLLVAFHGSWNRSVPTGYKIVRIDTSSSESIPVNFVTGWLNENGRAWGRPVDVKFDQKGNLFITDDEAGVIYKVIYQK